MKLFRIATLVLLPVITLALGWQLGITYETKQLASQYQRMSQILSVPSGSGTTVLGDPEKEVNMSLLWSVWRLLDRHYVAPEKLTRQTLVYGAVSGLVDSIGDPYTVFMTPKDSTTFHDALSGTLEGIGAQLDLHEGLVVIVTPLKGSPAEKAGLLSHDVITKVDDLLVSGMKLEEVVTHIRGTKGTTVTLGITRAGHEGLMVFKVTRDAIHIPSVESKILKSQTGSVAIITLNQFGDDSVSELRKAMTALNPKELKGLVLDLRFNGGGYLDGAVDLVSMFVRSGLVVSVARRDVPPEEHLVQGVPILPDIPLTVLINGGSASASEITAGALQDVKRATIIGTQSFGKGTVQEIIELPGGSSLRVTTARWLTPKGHDLGKKGVTPDIIVDRTLEQYKNGKDPQLDAAVIWLVSHRDITAGTRTATGAVQ